MRSEDSEQPVDTDVPTDSGAPSEERAAETSTEPRPGDSDAPTGQAEGDALQDRYLRLAAEYDNYRKRTERERLESRDRYQAQMVEGLLEALDDLRRVAAYSAETTSVQVLVEGVDIVERKFLKALESAGLELIDPAGAQFDPTIHEALFTSPAASEEEDDTVGQVLQPGYRFRGLLLRPARVEVRKQG